jgi:hypothetical protein
VTVTLRGIILVMTFLDWFRDNWFALLQSLGIVGGLFFTGISLRTDANVRRIGNLFTVTKHHREIWTTLYTRPELKRVIDASADLKAQPISDEEELFVNLLILHLASNYRAAKAGMFLLRGEIRADIISFFSLPIPRAVWKKIKAFQDKEFASFVENCLEATR